VRKKDNTFSPTIDGMSISEDSNTGNETATVAEQRNYSVLNVSDAKKISRVWLQAAQLENAVDFGLPEVDDRYHVWRVPLLKKATKERVGEVVIDAHTTLVLESDYSPCLKARGF
jgi:hypothetical protein